MNRAFEGARDFAKWHHAYWWEGTTLCTGGGKEEQMEFRLAARRLLLIGTPVLLASLMTVHQLIDQFGRPLAEQ